MSVTRAIRLRVMPRLIPVNGKSAEFRSDGTYIQWRYVGDANWINLVALADLKGPKGDKGDKGDDGGGVPNGGTTGQVLAKTSNANQAVGWTDAGVGDMLKASYDPTNKNADAFDAANTFYANGTSGMAANRVQGAIDELAARLPTPALSTMLVRRADNSQYDVLTAPNVRRFLGEGKTLNYFDYVPRNLRDNIAAGTDTTTDQAAYWQAFRDALQAEADAGRVPHGFVPRCTIRTSVAPNFAIPGLVLDTEGVPKIISTSSQPGFRMDGTGLGAGGWGLFGIKIGSFMAGGASCLNGIEITYIHQASFAPMYSLGATGTGIYISFCVSSVFEKPACSKSYIPGGAYLATPANGIVMTAVAGDPKGTACGWCTLIGPIAEYVANGIILDRAQGTLLLGGTAESCTSIGLTLSGFAIWTNVIGTDFEANTSWDVYCSAPYCTFVGIKSQDKFELRDLCNGTLVTGGTFNNILCASTTMRNTFRDLQFASQAGGAITDSAPNFLNRFINCINHQTEKPYSEWKTITGLTVSSSGGTSPTASATGRFFLDGVTLHFTVEITITTANGSGALRVGMPYVSRSIPNGGRSYCFAGIEIGHAADACTGYLAANDSVMTVRYATGLYPGDENGNFIVISGTYEIA